MTRFSNLFCFISIGIIYCNFHLVKGQHNLKDNCKTQSGDEGICTLLTQCPAVAKNANQNDIKMINICSFSGTTPVVCCPSVTSRFSSSDLKPKSLSVEKCREYGTAFLPHYPTQETPLCYEEVTSEGGVFDSKKNPHLAFIGFDDEYGSNNKRWACFGSLISNRYVVTAGHCLIHPLGVPKYVRLGNLKLNDNQLENSEEFNIESTVTHPSFHPSAMYNDIGLIKLDRDVAFNSFIHPACLNTESTSLDEGGTVTGMQLNFDSYKPEPERTIFTQKVNFAAWDHCFSAFNFTFKKVYKSIEDDSQVCTYSTEETHHCISVSGSPLLVRNSNEYCKASIVGVVSFPEPCGSIDIPTVYTRVSYFVPWIESIVWN